MDDEVARRLKRLENIKQGLLNDPLTAWIRDYVSERLELEKNQDVPFIHQARTADLETVLRFREQHAQKAIAMIEDEIEELKATGSETA